MQLALVSRQTYFRGMKRIQRIFGIGGIMGLLLAPPLLRGQDAPETTRLPAATAPQNNAAALAARQEAEENYNSLKGHIDDLIAAQSDQQKQIQELRRQVEDLRQLISKPNSSSVSQEDCKQLANSVQEIDRKREADKELILKEMEKLGRIVTDTPPPHGIKNVGTKLPPSDGGNTSTPPPNQSGSYCAGLPRARNQSDDEADSGRESEYESQQALRGHENIHSGRQKGESVKLLRR
jgi:hypothetical protein